MQPNGYAHMVQEYYVERVRTLQADRHKRLSQLRSPHQTLEYQQKTQRAIRRAFGPNPKKTPLNAKVTNQVKKQHFKIENVLFESRPGCHVSANLYLPNQQDGPIPAVLGACGHSHDGKADPLYQAFCQRLVRAGFAVLIYDPFNQGERDQYHRLTKREAVTNCCHAHNMMGKQLELVGEWFGAWRGWDGIRALDYLLSRSEIDGRHIGLTGNSGGGTITTWLWALERRFTMAAPSCFVTTFLANLENELPADCEQYPPGVLGAGLDMADFFIARGPDPCLLLGQKYDFFDRRGLDQAYEDIRYFYALLKAPSKNTGLFIGPQGHGFSHHNQEAMVDFFALHAGLPKPRKIRRPVILKAQELNATPSGNTVAAGATPIYELTADRANVLANKRPTLNIDAFKQRLKKHLKLPKITTVPHYRTLGATQLNGTSYARYAVETEHAIQIILYKRLPMPLRPYTLDVEQNIHLYVPHTATANDLQHNSWSQKLAIKHPLYSVDVRGLGESQPFETGDFFHPYGMDYMYHGHNLLLGESYLGRRVHDLLSTIFLLTNAGAKRIYLYGRGQGALIALFATFYADTVRHITMKNAPLSYHAWTQTPLISWPVANSLYGVLQDFDLPVAYRLLGRRLKLLEPWGPDMAPLKGKALQKAFQETKLPTHLLES